MSCLTLRSQRRCPRRHHRGFNLVELLIALGISAALLTSTMVALNACFIAYQTTTEEASTHTISRLIMHRVLSMVRTGTEFGPLPEDPLEELVESDYVEFTDHNGTLVRLTFDEQNSRLLYRVGEGDDLVLLAGVQRTVTGEGDDAVEMPAFVLEYEKGTHMRRFSMDLTVIPDDNQSTKFDLGAMRPIRLVASSMPRAETW
ncbi:MAG: prepilin-type N-terminal cleavage/methylation domain-containing protein [Phycisphaerae bacterium]|jgi:prepilin-type N-terminal cleavage/methylation domain-containing protein|nr:prepilin-type N-terminal cleavage/methylation domain-containing protein [Phycisphaerae bacterium]